MRKIRNQKNGIEKGAAILILSTALTKVIGALFKIPISSDYCLGDLGFGYFSTAYDLYVPINILAITGFPSVISKVISGYSAKNDIRSINKAFLSSKRLLLGIGIVSTILMLLFSYPYVLFTDNTGNSLYSIWCMVPCLLFSSIASIYRGYYTGLCNMKPTAVSNIIEALCKLILGFSVAYLIVKTTGNLSLASAGAILGITFGTVLSSVYLYLLYRNERKQNETQMYTFEKKEINQEIKKLANLAIPVIVIAITSSIPVLIDTLTVRFQLGQNIIENYGLIKEIYKDIFMEYPMLSSKELPTFLYGIKAKTYTLFNLIPTFTAMVGVSAIPVVSGFYSSKNIQEIQKSVGKTLKLSSFIALPMSAGFIAEATQIMNLIYGQNSSAYLGGKLLTIYGVCGIFTGSALVIGNLLLGVDLERKALRNIMIGLLVKAVANITLSINPNINILGSAYGTLLFYLAVSILHFITILKVCDYRLLLKAYFKPLVPSIICGITAYILVNVNPSLFMTVVSIGVAMVVYTISVVIFKVYSKKK